MAGLIGLSMDTCIYRKKEFFDDFFFSFFYLQHLGEEHCGVSVIKNGKIESETNEGLIKPNKVAIFRHQNHIEKLEGIACCDIHPQPFQASHSKFGPFSIAFTGKISNQDDLADYLLKKGFFFASRKESQDLEIISFFLLGADNIIQGIKSLTEVVQGSFSLLILTFEGIYAFCSDGHWPLAIGEKTGATIISSESLGLENLGFKLTRDCKPGEIIFLRNGSWHMREDKSYNPKICSFLWVYMSSPASKVNGISVDNVRKRLGAILAKRDIERGFSPDIVIPVPDSGRFHAIGYHQEFIRQANENPGSIKIPFYDELLMRFPYSGRSFLLSTQEKRDLEAHLKILRSSGSYEGTRVVVCDDSIVRGTQFRKNLIPKLRSLGIDEIHLRISNPELFTPCLWGKTTQQGEMLAPKMTLTERKTFLRADSLVYCSVEDLVKAIGLPENQLCLDCNVAERVCCV